MTQNSLEFCEFETKYRVEEHQWVKFKQIMESVEEPKSFLYVEGPDAYFLHPPYWFKHNPQWSPEGTFIRYRKPSYGLDNGRRQLTYKYKPAEAKNNIQRTEHNIDLGNTPENVVLEQLKDSGAVFNFEILKSCHIYKFEEATIVFYNVYDITDGEPKKAQSFIEIEVCEEKIKDMTPNEAWNIITKFEKIMEPLGINPQKRLRKSLFEMYKREHS